MNSFAGKTSLNRFFQPVSLIDPALSKSSLTESATLVVKRLFSDQDCLFSVAYLLQNLHLKVL